MTRSLRFAAWGAALALAALPARGEERASSWSVPPPGSCAPSGGLKGWPIGEDAPALAFRPGDVISLEKAPAIKAHLPPAVWEQRDKFFFEGMRLEIGPCFRDYAPPDFFSAATEKFRGQAKLTAEDGLEGYTAGLPFAPDTIDPADPKAGEKWAWNFAQRYQAAGLRGKFRVSDMVGRTGRAEPFEGEIFRLYFAGRPDRAATGYEAPGAERKQWIAGGIYFTPFAAREYAWRQYRNVESRTEAARSDELWAYLPEWRRVRRINASQVEGLYMPSFSVGVQQATEIAVGGGAATAGGGAVGAAGTGGGGGTITTKRSGFEGLEIRPLLYGFRVLGLQDVLAPINAANALYPAQPDRDFGPWGLSFASDRWELRRALVLEGTSKEAKGGDQVAKVILYLDLQTLHPLYYLSFDAKGEARDVGMYVGRWSEDRTDYPKWPDDPARPVRVVDSVGASFANLAESGGWRRESWDVVGTPPDDDAVKNLVSVSKLTRGH